MATQSSRSKSQAGALLHTAFPAPIMKKPAPETKQRMCTRKRRYRTQGDALDAALVAGVERQRQAYRCAICGLWHLTSR